MQFTYKAIEKDGTEREGTIDAISVDVAITSLQRRGLIVSSVTNAQEAGGLFGKKLTFFQHVSIRDIVILSRQIATLFEARVSALQVFKLIASETENEMLRTALVDIADNLQGGSLISKALARHPKIFSSFYVSMVSAGEESGKLDETFTYLADYLERSYEVTSKARNALIYPAFVIFVFVAVMVLMLTKVIPSISKILVDSGQPIPIYTQVIISLSNFLVDYGIYVLIALLFGGVFLGRYVRTGPGKMSVAKFKLEIPYVGTLYRKLYLARISSNFYTMLASAIPIVKAIEITADVVDNAVYEAVLRDTAESVKTGMSLSQALIRHEEIPSILVQMVRVGEESGELGSILQMLSRFYEREVTNAVDTLVSLIEPLMIVLLGLGVGFLLAAVLIPIYNISAGVS